MREFAEAQVNARLERVVAEIERMRTEMTEDAVHDLRVSIRRLAQALRLFGELLGKKAARALRQQVRPLLKCAGEVRNRDIAIAIVRRSKTPGAPALVRTLKEERTAAMNQLHVLLEAFHGVDLRRQWARKKGGEQWDAELSPAENVRTVLPGLARKFMKAGNRAVREETAWADLHQFRLRGKRFRYTLELFTPVYGKGLEGRIEAMRKIQTVLGDINDYETMLAMEPLKGDSPLVEWLTGKREERRKKFAGLWNQEFGGVQAEARWIGYFKRYAR
jgi:CHAD domain-containing protein